MGKTIDLKLLRLLDANFNRSREGLRVCEDICRFIYDNKTLTKHLKAARHRLTDLAKELKINEHLVVRDIDGDVGTVTIPHELKRKDYKELFFANAQRVKEALRVLEEVTKINNKEISSQIKQLRYMVYGLEKKFAS